MVATKIAHVNVQRHAPLLRPGVDAQMGFSQQHGGCYTACTMGGGRKRVKQVRHALQAGVFNGLHAAFTQAGSVGQPGGITTALVQVGGQMESLHKADFNSPASNRPGVPR